MSLSLITLIFVLFVYLCLTKSSSALKHVDIHLEVKYIHVFFSCYPYYTFSYTICYGNCLVQLLRIANHYLFCVINSEEKPVTTNAENAIN
jgi:hypothetical protein